MRIRTALQKIGNDLPSLTVSCSLLPCRISLPSRHASKAFSMLLVTLLSLASLPSMANGDQLEDLAKKAGIRILSDGESSSDSQRKTAASLPFHLMSPTNRQRARKLINDSTQYRRLPSLQYSIDKPIYRYLLEHPDVAVSTWRVMGISRFEMFQTGPMEYEAKAVDGSEGIADILYKDDNQMLFICEGNYHNVLLPRPLEASALIWFRAAYAPGADGTHVVTQKADVFVKFPSAGLSTVAKMLTPVTNSMMDRNLFEVSLYSSMMSRAVRDEPEWVVHVADQMEGVLPQRRGELIEVARQPRKIAHNATPEGPVTSVDRSVIMSPQLLFFDPPKDGTRIVADEGKSSEGPIRTAELSKGAVPVKPVSGSPPSNLTIIPASRVPKPVRAEDSGKAAEKTKSQSDDEFELQPAEPPAGSTATDPAGSGSKP